MAKRTSKVLIVDTSIARSAGGEDAQHPVSTGCRDVLTTILKVCHRLGMTADLQTEWKKHRSRFCRVWLSSMYARKKVVKLEEPRRMELEQAIFGFAKTELIRDEMLKDVHLVSGALSADKIVLALDDTARARFAVFTEVARDTAEICWANPVCAEEGCIDWLKEGSELKNERTLGDYYGRMDLIARSSVNPEIQLNN